MSTSQILGQGGPAPAPRDPGAKQDLKLDKTLPSFDRPFRVVENFAWTIPGTIEGAIVALFKQDERITSIDIGRGPPEERARLEIRNVELSRSHARLDRDAKSGALSITDTGSFNGTYVRHADTDEWKRLERDIPHALTATSEVRFAGESASMLLKVGKILSPQSEKAVRRIDREGHIELFSSADFLRGVGKRIEDKLAQIGSSIIVGRATDGSFKSGDPLEKVSVRHLLITRTNDGYTVQNLSSNGTWVSFDAGATNVRLVSGKSLSVKSNAVLILGDTRNKISLSAVERSLGETIPAVRQGASEPIFQKPLQFLAESRAPIYVGRALVVEDPRNSNADRLVDIITGGSDVSRCHAIIDRGQRGYFRKSEAWVISNVSSSNPILIFHKTKNSSTKIQPGKKGYANPGDSLGVGGVRIALPSLG